MPATAAQHPSDGEPSLAPVVDLSSRRGTRAPAIEDAMRDTTDAEPQEKAAEHWRKVFKGAGIDLDAPLTAAVVGLLTRELERLVGGLLVIREGRDDLPANPAAGVDFTSAVEVTSILRDLARTIDRTGRA